MSSRFVRSLKILVIVFPIIVGSITTLYGIILYSRSQLFTPEDRATPPGLLIFSSIGISRANFSIQVVELNFEQDRSDKTLLQFDFTLETPLTGEQTIGFQFPYVVEKFDAESLDFGVNKREIIHETTPRSNGAQNTEVSIVYFTFSPKQDNNHYSLRGFLSWSGLLSRIDYATYRFVVPFARDAGALRDSIRSLVPDPKVRCLTQIEGDHVYVMVNAAASVKLVYPVPSSVVGFPGYTNQMLSWDLSYPSSIPITHEYGGWADTIVVNFELGSVAEQRNRFLFEAGIYTGLGASLILSGLHEALKYVEEIRKGKESLQANRP